MKHPSLFNCLALSLSIVLVSDCCAQGRPQPAEVEPKPAEDRPLEELWGMEVSQEEELCCVAKFKGVASTSSLTGKRICAFPAGTTREEAKEIKEKIIECAININ